MYLLMISTRLDDLPAFAGSTTEACEDYYLARSSPEVVQDLANKLLAQIGRDDAEVTRVAIVRLGDEELADVKELWTSPRL